MILPGWWQAYLIAGELMALLVISLPPFEANYRAFRDYMEARPGGDRISRRARIITGCIAMAFVILIWLPMAAGVLVRLVHGFIAGFRSGGRR